MKFGIIGGKKLCTKVQISYRGVQLSHFFSLSFKREISNITFQKKTTKSCGKTFTRNPQSKNDAPSGMELFVSRGIGGVKFSS